MIPVILVFLLIILSSGGCVQTAATVENNALVRDTSHLNQEFKLLWKDDPVINTSRIHSRKRKNLKNFAK